MALNRVVFFVGEGNYETAQSGGQVPTFWRNLLLPCEEWACTLTLRRLMSYIYMEHPFLMFLDHTQRRSTVGRTTLDE